MHVIDYRSYSIDSNQILHDNDQRLLFVGCLNARKRIQDDEQPPF